MTSASAEFSTQTRKQLRTPQPEFKEFVESGRWKEGGTKAKETEATQAEGESTAERSYEHQYLPKLPRRIRQLTFQYQQTETGDVLESLRKHAESHRSALVGEGGRRGVVGTARQPCGTKTVDYDPTNIRHSPLFV